MIIWLLALPFSFLALGIFTNLRRRRRNLRYELTPNCLLTRWPILFVTGRRSVFYFSRYWNVYPEFLTEHGYEVYTLHLPWSDARERARRFSEFLREHSRQERRYHLVLDAPSQEEFAALFTNQNFSCIESLNGLSPEECVHSALGLGQSLSYRLHRLRTWPKVIADPHSLGVSPEASLQNARSLLHKIAQRAEEDLQSP